mmetsp:Transcript_13691/g.14890  ORF Transcript_13691/g.14890 Transcript_13691/m.14890 type:complete len:880 (-) Transcript_13691:664-3303(-)
MSAKFRTNRKYRVSSGNYSNTSRPMTASSATSLEESYHSDFEELDGPNFDEAKSSLFLMGESINDKLNLSSEFNVGGSLLEEDEDNYSTYDNQTIKDEEVRELVDPEPDEDADEEYEDEFSSPISTAMRVNHDITSPYPAYDDDVFEIASPMQLSHDPNDPKQRDIFSSGTTSPHQQSTHIPIIVENADDHQTILPSHQQPSIGFHEASTADNTLAEFSSITFGNSEVIQADGKKKKKRKVATIVDPNAPSEKKSVQSKIAKKRVGTPGLPTIKSPRLKNDSKAGESSSPKSVPSKFHKQSPKPSSNNQMTPIEKYPSLPPRPKSHPVKSSVNQSVSNKKIRHKVQSANSRNHSSSSQRHRNDFETPVKLPQVNDAKSIDRYGRSKDENDADVENEDDDFNDDGTRKSNRTQATKSSAIKYQKIPITTESSVIGKPSLTTFSYYNSGSVVTSRGRHYSEATLPIPELQKQYRVALKQIKELKEKNQLLLDQLDQSKVQETIQDYQYQLIQKQQIIDQLSSENLSYKTIIRNQEKGLIQHSNEKEQEFDILEHQEKDIEVLFEQLKRVKKKMFVHKEKELEKQLIIDDLKLQVNKLKQKNNKWKKQYEQLSLSHQEVSQRLQEKERNDLTSAEQRSSNDMLPPPIVPVLDKPKPDLVEESSVITSQIEVLEKRYNAQMKVLQYDNQSYKQDILQKQKLIDQFTKELQKRDIFIQHQTNILKSLKYSYQELSDNCHHLLQGSILIGRDSKKPTPVKQPPPPNPPKHRKTEIPKLKAKPPEQKKGLLVIDESEEEQDQEIKKEEIEGEGQVKEHSASSANILALLSLDDVKDTQIDPHGSMLNDDNEVKVVEENHEKANTAFFITEESEVDEYEDEEYENED